MSINYLNVVFTSDQIRDGKQVASSVCFPLLDFGADLVDGSFSEGKGMADIMSNCSGWCNNCCVGRTTCSAIYILSLIFSRYIKCARLAS